MRETLVSLGFPGEMKDAGSIPHVKTLQKPMFLFILLSVFSTILEIVSWTIGCMSMEVEKRSGVCSKRFRRNFVVIADTLNADLMLFGTALILPGLDTAPLLRVLFP